MGRALAAAFVRAGHPTTVWNRTSGRPAVAGAVVAATAAEAVQAAPTVVVCVLDATAAQEVLEQAAPQLEGRTVINLSGDSPDRCRELAGWVESKNAFYLDGVIMAGTQAIGGPEASFLISGAAETWELQQPVLASLGTATYLGEDPGRAAAYDVALLDVFWNSVGGILHAFALASAEDIPATELAPHAKTMIGMLPDLVDVLAQHVTTKEYPGDESNLYSAATGLRNVIHAARARGLQPGGLQPLLDTADKAIAAGHGEEAVSRLAEVLLR